MCCVKIVVGLRDKVRAATLRFAYLLTPSTVKRGETVVQRSQDTVDEAQRLWKQAERMGMVSDAHVRAYWWDACIGAPWRAGAAAPRP